MFEVRNVTFGGAIPAVAIPISGRTEAEICAEAVEARGAVETRTDCGAAEAENLDRFAQPIDCRRQTFLSAWLLRYND